MKTPRCAALLLTTALLTVWGASSAWAQGAEPTPPPPGTAAPDGAPPHPKTPLPPRDTPRAPQPGGDNAAGGLDAGAGPKTPLPPRDAPRAPQPQNGQKAAQDADWPCVQRKVSELSYGQMWAGPPLDDALGKWRDDGPVSDLVPKLVARRTSMDDAKAAIEDFAKKAGDKKNEELTLLFAGVFDTLNDERSHIVDGIDRYAKKQRALSDKIKDESLKMSEQHGGMAEQMSPEGQKKQQELDWDTRIYDERTQSLHYVCETPTILEQRVFDLGREIQNLLGSG